MMSENASREKKKQKSAVFKQRLQNGKLMETDVTGTRGGAVLDEDFTIKLHNAQTNTRLAMEAAEANKVDKARAESDRKVSFDCFGCFMCLAHKCFCFIRLGFLPK